MNREKILLNKDNVNLVVHRYSNVYLEAILFLLFSSIVVFALLITVLLYDIGVGDITYQFYTILPIIVSFLFGYSFLPWLSWKLAGGYEIRERIDKNE